MSDYIATVNGSLKDPETGHFLPGVKPKTAIADRSHSLALHRAKKEKRENAIRAAIRDRTPDAKNGLHAVAIAAGIMWEDVLDPEKDLDKRRKAWLTIGRQAGILEDGVQTLDNDTVQSLAIADSLLAVRDIIHELVKSNGTV